MKKTILLALVLAFVFGLTVDLANAKLVACVGDSITYGYGLSDRDSDCYPTQLAKILQEFDKQWETRNFGVSGATVFKNGWRPYVLQEAYHNALASEPDVVIIMLGTCDSHPEDWVLKDDFVSDYCDLIEAFAQLPSNPEIWICNPVPMFFDKFAIRNSVIRDEMISLISQVAELKDVGVIDLYTALSGGSDMFPDGIHPNTEGAKLMAEIVASVILGFRFLPDFNGDGNVDIEDLIILIEHWHQDKPSLDIAPAPFGDGILDCADLEVLMAYWGQEINDPTLIAHWALDEIEGDIASDSANDNDGTVYGDPAWQPEGGMVDGALQLDGIDDYVNTPFVLNPADGKFSVFVWIKGGAPGQTILSQMGGARWLCADPSDGNLMTELTESGQSGAPMFSQTNITDGNWHRIGLVWDGSHRTLYVDDIAVAEDTQANLAGSYNGLYIGTGKAMEPGSFWSGLIDDVRIYNRAVTP